MTTTDPILPFTLAAEAGAAILYYFTLYDRTMTRERRAELLELAAKLRHSHRRSMDMRLTFIDHKLLDSVGSHDDAATNIHNWTRSQQTIMLPLSRAEAATLLRKVDVSLPQPIYDRLRDLIKD